MLRNKDAFIDCFWNTEFISD